MKHVTDASNVVRGRPGLRKLLVVGEQVFFVLALMWVIPPELSRPDVERISRVHPIGASVLFLISVAAGVAIGRHSVWVAGLRLIVFVVFAQVLFMRMR